MVDPFEIFFSVSFWILSILLSVRFFWDTFITFFWYFWVLLGFLTTCCGPWIHLGTIGPFLIHLGLFGYFGVILGVLGTFRYFRMLLGIFDYFSTLMGTFEGL